MCVYLSCPQPTPGRPSPPSCPPVCPYHLGKHWQPGRPCLPTHCWLSFWIDGFTQALDHLGSLHWNLSGPPFLLPPCKACLTSPTGSGFGVEGLLGSGGALMLLSLPMLSFHAHRLLSIWFAEGLGKNCFRLIARQS